MLTRIHLEEVFGVKKLTLITPRLLEVYKVSACPQLTVGPSGYSVVKVITDRPTDLCFENLRLVQHLYLKHIAVGQDFLEHLNDLLEVHLQDQHSLPTLFRWIVKHQRFGLAVFLCGCRLNGPNDPAIDHLSRDLNSENFSYPFVQFESNPLRTASEIPFITTLSYSAAMEVNPDSVITIFRRFTDLKEIKEFCKIKNVQRFLSFLENFENISQIAFMCDQRADLFDRLPAHLALQSLTIPRPHSADFVYRLENLMRLEARFNVDSDTIPDLFNYLKFLVWFTFLYGEDHELKKKCSIVITGPKQFTVWAWLRSDKTFTNLDAAIMYIKTL